MSGEPVYCENENEKPCCKVVGDRSEPDIKCPMRPTSQQVALPKGHRKANQRFTTDQRDSWVGSHMSAAAECGASEEFQQKYGLWLAMLVSAYAPFERADVALTEGGHQATAYPPCR